MFPRIVSLLLLTLAAAAQAAEPLVLRVWPERPAGAAPETIVERGQNGVVDRSISEVSDPTLTVYLPAGAGPSTSAVLVLPGGGYDHLAIDKEGHDMGRWFSSIGVVGVSSSTVCRSAPISDSRRMSEPRRMPTGQAACATWRLRSRMRSGR